MLQRAKCHSCVHYQKVKKNKSCPAFPDEIPHFIFHGEMLHLNKMKHQVGDFVYEPNNKIDEDNHKRFMEQLTEFIPRKNQLKKEAISIAKEIFDDLNTNKGHHFIRAEIRIYLVKNRMVKTVDEILFFNLDEKPELISIGFNSELFKRLNAILFLDSIKNYTTNIELILNEDGTYELNLEELTLLEKIHKNEILISTQRQRARNILINKGLKSIPITQLEEEVKLIIHQDEKPIHNHSFILKTLHEKGFAVIDSDITEFIKKAIRESRSTHEK